MQKKTTIGAGIGVAVGQLVVAAISTRRAGGGGTLGGLDSIDCLLWLLYAEIILVWVLVICVSDCDSVDEQKCGNRCFTKYLYGSLVVTTLFFACIGFG